MSIGDTQSEIIQNIVEFYRIQPGISLDILEKLEEYLVLMNSFYINAITEVTELDISDNLLESLLDILNTYINSILEEYEKIFPDEDLEIQAWMGTNTNLLNEMQVLEYLKNINGRNADRFFIRNQIKECDELIYEEDFPGKLLETLQKLIQGIHSEIIVRVEDLIT